MKIKQDIAFFERGLIAGFEDAGLDKYAAAGFVAGYSEYVGAIDEIIKQAEQLSGDPDYRIKLAEEIEKEAAGENILEQLKPLLEWAKQHKEVVGGVGGGLAGLYLGSRNKRNPGMGGMLGGLAGAGAGAGLGHYLPQIIEWIKGLMGGGKKPGVDPKVFDPTVKAPDMAIETPGPEAFLAAEAAKNKLLAPQELPENPLNAALPSGSKPDLLGGLEGALANDTINRKSFKPAPVSVGAAGGPVVPGDEFKPLPKLEIGALKNDTPPSVLGLPPIVPPGTAPGSLSTGGVSIHNPSGR